MFYKRFFGRGRISPVNHCILLNLTLSWALILIFPTFVNSSFKVNGVALYLSDFQKKRLLFFVTTQRILQREEVFKSRIGRRVDRPVSVTNCLEQASNNAILVITKKITCRRASWEMFIVGKWRESYNTRGINGIRASRKTSTQTHKQTTTKIKKNVS